MKIEVEKLFPKIPKLLSQFDCGKGHSGKNIENSRLIESTENCRGRHRTLADGALTRRIKYLMAMASDA